MICLTNCPLAVAANNSRFTDNENCHILEITVLDLSMKVKRVSLLIVFANLAPVQLHSSTQTEFVFIQVLRTKSNFFSQQPLMSTLEPAISYCEDPHCFDILFLHQCNVDIFAAAFIRVSRLCIQCRTKSESASLSFSPLQLMSELST